ncbi:MAG: hypothetical protein COB22_00050 [Cycloclasticus sp.]|nr:MAG: hypothetical protein COB22_00050 [Cycloclasticus sp.]
MKSLTFIRYNRKVNHNNILKTLENDIYFLMLSEFVRKGILRNIFFIYFSEVNYSKRHNGIDILFLKKAVDIAPEALNTHYLWVRGDKKEYLPLIRMGKWNKRFFYGASSYYIPYKTWGYDAVLLDENEHISIVQKEQENTLGLRLLKPANEQVFMKLDKVEKIYDICIFSTLHKNPGAFLKIYEAFPELNYVVIGRDNVPEIEHIKDNSNLKLTGFISHEKANKYLNQSKIGIILSLRDGAPRVIVESMSAGLPQIVNKRLSSGKSYINSSTGLFSGDDEILDKVEFLLMNYKKMSPEAYYKEHFSLEKATNKLSENLDKIDALPPKNKLYKLKLKLFNNTVISKLRGHVLKRY